MTFLNADSPLQDRESDAFGYLPFAQHVARALVEMVPDDGFAVSIQGPWGCGKSTVLNFVRQTLDAVPPEKRPLVVTFNAWWFSGSDDLIGHFFRELLGHLDVDDKRTRMIRKRVAEFADVAASVPVTGFSWFRILKAFALTDRSVHRLRDALDKCLRESDKRIVVVIDDVDRLTPDEIRQLFQVVRAVVNLPRITYLLAYDAERVSESLGGGDTAAGLAYLEKIVQVPFDLPVPSRSALSIFFTNRLQAIVGELPEDEFDHVRWANVYVDGIERFLTSPRSVIRLTNALSLSLPAVRAEVDIIDFVSIEALRLSAPRAYDAIRHSPRLFSGAAERSSREQSAVEKEEIEAVLASAPRQLRALKTVLLSLFPRLHSVLGNTHFGSDHEARWRRERRAASLDHLETYFRLAVPAGQFSATEMRRAIAMMSSRPDFAAYMRGLLEEEHSPGVSRAREFLSRLEDYTESTIPEESVVPALATLFSIGDDLIRAEPDREQPFDFGMGVQVARVLLQLLRRLPTTARLARIRELAPSAAVYTIVDISETLVAQHDPSRDERLRLDPVLASEEAADVKDLAVGRLRTAAASGELDTAPHLPSLLRRWGEWATEKEMRAWLDGRLESDDFFYTFMTHFVQTSLSWGLSDRAVRKSRGVDLKWLGRFIDPAAAQRRAVASLMVVADQQRAEALRLISDTVSGLIPEHGSDTPTRRTGTG